MKMVKKTREREMMTERTGKMALIWMRRMERRKRRRRGMETPNSCHHVTGLLSLSLSLCL